MLKERKGNDQQIPHLTTPLTNCGDWIIYLPLNSIHKAVTTLSVKGTQCLMQLMVKMTSLIDALQ